MGILELRMTYPLRVFTGHTADGSRDWFPDPARVFSALVQAAYSGSTAVTSSDGNLDASASSLKALRWLEEHPPDALHIPETVAVCDHPPTAYRKEGLISKEGRRVVDKTSGKATDDGVAVNGSFGMTWNEAPPHEVVAALDALCADVSHVGEALSPTVLEVAHVVEEGAQLQASWLRDPRARRFTPGGIQVRVPKRGRLDELNSAHAAVTAGKPPTSAADKHKTSETSVRTQLPRTRTTPIRYVEPTRPAPALPWTHAILLSVEGLHPHPDQPPTDFTGGIPADQRVSWCVALHRVLARRVRGPAPALITGNYPTGFHKPANRLAIQYLDPALMAASAYANSSGDYGAFLLLVPADAASDDLLILESALSGLNHVHSRHGVAYVAVRSETVSTEDFWNSPGTGLQRLRVTVPAMISDIRRQRRTWTLKDSVLAAIGFTWRDQANLGAALSGPDRYRRLVESVQERMRPAVLDATRLPVDGSAFAHKLPAGVVAEPFRATIDFRDRLAPGALCVIGQSRHLGGGLLAPLDVPAGLFNSLPERQT